MTIRSKMLLLIGGVTIIILGVLVFAIVSYTSFTVENQLYNDLENQSLSISQQITDQIDATARSYLTAVGEDSIHLANSYRQLYEKEILSYDEVYNLTMEVISNRSFFDRGFVYITDNSGRIIMHRDDSKIGSISPILSWLQRLKPEERSFKDVGDGDQRVLTYRVYYEPLEINICVTAYISDFYRAVNWEELNKSINVMRNGESGYPFILDSSGNFLTHPYLRGYTNPKITIEDADGMKIIERILSKGEGSFHYRWREQDRSIKEKLLTFRQDENTGLYIVLTAYVEEIFSTVEEIRRISYLLGGVGILVIFFVIFYLSSRFSRPIREFNERLLDISQGDGDLTERINISTSGEIGAMVNHFNYFVEHLQTSIIEIKKSSKFNLDSNSGIITLVDSTLDSVISINQHLENMLKKTEDLSYYSEQSSKSSEVIGVNMEQYNSEMSHQMEMFIRSTDNITNIISSIDELKSLTLGKRSSSEELLKRAIEGEELVNQTQDAVDAVTNQLDKINDMADIISDIASQTNMLSMNAAIEAAHAGDAGKGFAVVADEIRKLSESSAENSIKISKTLKEVGGSITRANMLSQNTHNSFELLHEEINNLVNALDNIVEQSSVMQHIGQDTSVLLTDLNGISRSIMDRFKDILKEVFDMNSVITQTREATLEVVEVINEVSGNASGIEDSMSEVQRSSTLIREDSDRLDNIINQFKTS